jgi:ABC-type ATPase with predicted acetyltransferase domain
MKALLHVEYELKPKKPSLAAGKIFGSFGLESSPGRREYVKPFTLEFNEKDIIAFVGISGTGKTTCLQQLKNQTVGLDLNELVFDNDKTVIEHFENYDIGLKNLSICGLAEAQLFLRYPNELSDGQRYRFRMALGLSDKRNVLVCDEFLATLDRISAKTIAFSIRKLISNSEKILAIATTHTDILEDLQPNITVNFGPEGVEIAHEEIIKKKSHFIIISSLHAALEQIGTGLVSGITEEKK